MSKLASIIIVNWNGKKHLETCLSSLQKQNYSPVEIILVDNASHDDSVTYVHKHFPKIKIVINQENFGFAEANNIGYRQAKGEYIVFLNNDTRVSKNFLSELIKTIDSDPQIGGAQSKILLMDEPDRLDSIGSFLTETGFLYHYAVGKKDEPKYNHRIDLYSVKGACMIFKREALEKTLVDNEVFDRRYFAYFEETDLCHRVWLAGYRIVYAPTSVIYHKMGGTSKGMDNAFIQYHSFKNRINSYLKNLNLVDLLTLLPLHLVICEGYSVYSVIKMRGSLGIFLAIQRAIAWNVTQLPVTLAKRRVVRQKIRRVKDRSLEPIIFRRVKLSYYIHLTLNLRKYEE